MTTTLTHTQDIAPCSLSDLYGYCLDSYRERVIEDWQNYSLLDWASLTVTAQEVKLRSVDEQVMEAVEEEQPFARIQAQYMALDDLILYSDLIESVQAQVDAEAEAMWRDEAGERRYRTYTV